MLPQASSDLPTFSSPRQDLALFDNCDFTSQHMGSVQRYLRKTSTSQLTSRRARPSTFDFRHSARRVDRINSHVAYTMRDGGFPFEEPAHPCFMTFQLPINGT